MKSTGTPKTSGGSMAKKSPGILLKRSAQRGQVGGISSRPAVLVHDCRDNQNEGEQPHNIDIGRKFVGSPDREQNDPLQHKQQERAAECQEESVARAPPKVEKEKRDGQ